MELRDQPTQLKRLQEKLDESVGCNIFVRFDKKL